MTWYAGGLRELPGAVKAAYEAAFTPDPHFLGPREPGVRRALAESAKHRGHHGHSRDGHTHQSHRRHQGRTHHSTHHHSKDPRESDRQP
jgi:hypothetical protein